MKRLNDSSDVPEARLGTLPKTFTSSKRTTKLHFILPRRNGYSQLRQQKSRSSSLGETLWGSWVYIPRRHLHHRSQHRRTEKTEILKNTVLERSGGTNGVSEKPAAKIHRSNWGIRRGTRRYIEAFGENLVDESTSIELWRNPQQGSQDTSNSSRHLPMESWAKVEPGFG